MTTNDPSCVKKHSIINVILWSLIRTANIKLVFLWKNAIAARDLKHRRRRRMTTTRSNPDYLNTTAHASLVVHTQSRTLSRAWKPSVCCPAVNDLKWSDKHDVVLCREVLVMGLNEHRYGSKEIGDVCRMVWWDFSHNSSSCSKPEYCSLFLPKRSNLEAIAGSLQS